MLAFLQNPWVVGIGAGIISGIIVYFITNWIYKRKDDSKHIHQINSANKDIIHALRTYVAERGLPEKEVIDAIIVSTARKYNIKSDELYSVRIICEELIREVVENIYVSSEDKHELTKQLSMYLHALDMDEHKSYLVTDIEKEIRNQNVLKESNYRRITATYLSKMMSVFVALLTTIVSFISIKEMAGSKMGGFNILIVEISLGAIIAYLYILNYIKRKQIK